MAICREKRGGRVYLAEYKSAWEDGKVRHRFVRYLGREGPDGRPIRPPRRVLDNVDISGTRRYGDVAVMWKLAEDLQFPEIIDRITHSNSEISTGKLLTLWAVNRALSPESTTALPQWIRRTSLDELAEIPSDLLNKDRFLRALDDVCLSDEKGDEIYNYSLAIERQLFRRNVIDPEALAYDLTSTYFCGSRCPLSKVGFTRDKRFGSRQIVIGLAVSRKDHLPLFHQVYPGNTADVSTVVQFLRIASGFGIRNSTVIWDRVMTTEQTLEVVQANKFQLIAALPATRDDVKETMKLASEIDQPKNFIKRCGGGALYGTAVQAKLFERNLPAVVCSNTSLREDLRSERNEALMDIQDSLAELAIKGKDWSEKRLHDQVSNIIGNYDSLLEVRVKRNGSTPRISTRIKRNSLRALEATDGRYVILHTDASLSSRQVVEEYHGKDFIEKVFRTMKQDIDLHPVRHRIPSRVHSYVLVCVLAYYLRAQLNALMRKLSNPPPLDDFLEDLAVIQRTTLSTGKNQSVRYLNLGTKMRQTLKSIGFGTQFHQITRLQE